MEQGELRELQEMVRDASAFIKPLRTEIGRIMVGQEKLVDGLLMALIADGHALLEGLPGLAKTLAVKLLSQAVDSSFSRVQFTPDLLPADVVGTTIYNHQTQAFTAKKGPVFANFVLADEINRAPAKVQSALLECMQERQVTISGVSHPLPRPFLVLATQNPIEQEGTYPLPEAQVDRFMFKLEIGYPSRQEEKIVVERMARSEPELAVAPVATLADIEKARKALDRVYVDEKIVEYILDIVRATRPGGRRELSPRQSEAKLDDFEVYIQCGASPRAAIFLALGAKAAAFLEGRAYVVPQDVKSVAPAVLRHRLALSYEAEAENLNANELVRRLLDELRTP